MRKLCVRPRNSSCELNNKAYRNYEKIKLDTSQKSINLTIHENFRGPNFAKSHVFTTSNTRTQKKKNEHTHNIYVYLSVKCRFIGPLLNRAIVLRFPYRAIEKTSTERKRSFFAANFQIYGSESTRDKSESTKRHYKVSIRGKRETRECLECGWESLFRSVWPI